MEKTEGMDTVREAFPTQITMEENDVKRDNLIAWSS